MFYIAQAAILMASLYFWKEKLPSLYTVHKNIVHLLKGFLQRQAYKHSSLIDPNIHSAMISSYSLAIKYEITVPVLRRHTLSDFHVSM